MADYSIPLQVQQPNVFGMLNNVLGAQEETQKIQQQNIQLQAQQQANQERQAVLPLMKQFANPDGTFDINSATPVLASVAPQTWSNYTKQMQDHNSQMLDVNKKALNLGQEKLQAVGQVLQSTVDKDPSERVGIISSASNELPGTKPVFDTYLKSVSQITNGPFTDQHKQAALQALDQSWSTWYMTMQDRQQMGTADYRQMNLPGGKQVIYQPKPGVPGAPVTSPVQPSATLPSELTAAEKASGFINSATGQFVPSYPFAGRTAGAPAPVSGGGVAPGARSPGATGWPQPPQMPRPEQMQLVDQATKQYGALTAGDADTTTGYMPTKAAYQKVIQLVKEHPEGIGPGSAANDRLYRILTPLGMNANAKPEEVGAFMDRIALGNAATMGLGTDASRKMAEGATGSKELSPEALLAKARFGLGTLEANHAYVTGLRSATGNGSNLWAKQDFDSEWVRHANLDSFTRKALRDIGDKEGYGSVSVTPQMISNQNALNMLIRGNRPAPQ